MESNQQSRGGAGRDGKEKCVIDTHTYSAIPTARKKFAMKLYIHACLCLAWKRWACLLDCSPRTTLPSSLAAAVALYPVQRTGNLFNKSAYMLSCRMISIAAASAADPVEKVCVCVCVCLIANSGVRVSVTHFPTHCILILIFSFLTFFFSSLFFFTKRPGSSSCLSEP